MKDHELFPSEDDKPAPDVRKIMVERVEPDGKKVWPFGFVNADELPNLAALYERCGGGRYELVARDAKTIVARRAYNLPGPSKPLDGSPPAVPPTVAPSTTMQASPFGGVTLAGIVGALAPLVLGYLDMSAKRDAAQTQLFMAMLNAKGHDSAAHIQAMQAMYSAQTEQMARLFATMKPGAGAEDALVKGVELAMSLQQGAADGASEGSGGGGIMNAAQQGLEMVQQIKHLVDNEPGLPKTPTKRRTAAPPPPPAPEPDEPSEDDEGDDEPSEAAE
jgi:hypothetical protein